MRSRSNKASKGKYYGTPSSNGKQISRLPSLSNVAANPRQSDTLLGSPQEKSYGVSSQQGKRPYQEDEYSIRLKLGGDYGTETHFFGLFDGHAGGRCSKFVANALPAVLEDDPLFFSNLPLAIKRSYHAVNEQFLKVADKNKLHDGSTGISAILRENKLIVANVGDCRALVVGGGKSIQMSIDQKPANLEEQKRITALGGSVVYCMGVARVNRVLAVSRAFGNRTLCDVIRPDAELMQRELTGDDEYLVMASDGLWDVLRNKDVCDVCSMNSSQSPQYIADQLVQSALARGSMDNVTCIVACLPYFTERYLSTTEASSNLNGYLGIPMRELRSDHESSTSDLIKSIQNIANREVVDDFSEAEATKNGLARNHHDDGPQFFSSTFMHANAPKVGGSRFEASQGSILPSVQIDRAAAKFLEDARSRLPSSSSAMRETKYVGMSADAWADKNRQPVHIKSIKNAGMFQSLNSVINGDPYNKDDFRNRPSSVGNTPAVKAGISMLSLFG